MDRDRTGVRDVTGVRLADLPPAVRARVEAELGRSRPHGKSRAGVSSSAPCPGHCACGAPFPTAAAWERHAAATGCSRWNIDLGAIT